MDPRLAEIYGTNSEEQTQDTEKVAAAQLAEKLAGDESLNLEGMSEDQIEALAQEVLAQGAEEQTEAAAEETEEAEATEETEEKQASEKLAEADYLGRVMAHSYVQELKNIEKQAGAKETAGKVMGHVKRHASDVKEGFKDLAHMAKSPRQAASALKDSVKSQGVKGTIKGNKNSLKALGATGLGTAGAGAAAKKAKDKKSSAVSALDTLAAQRALEILAENGIDYNEETEVEEKTASNPADALAAAVETRAMELLQAEGYEFESEEAEAE